MPRGVPKNPRTQRSAETRESENRVAKQRPVPSSAHASRYHIPLDVIPKGFTYAWVAVAHDNAGTPNADNWQRKYRKGWRPVPRDRHPDLFPPVPNIGFGDDTDGFIKEGGQILCERPTKDVMADKKANERAARAQMDGVKWTQGPDQNPFMPRFDDSSKTEFAHSAEFKE